MSYKQNCQAGVFWGCRVENGRHITYVTDVVNIRGTVMSTKVTASDVQKNFGIWHDKALKEPVQITKYGRETVYLVSAETFHELWASYRRARSTRDLSDREMARIDQAQDPPQPDYDYPEHPQPIRKPEKPR